MGNVWVRKFHESIKTSTASRFRGASLSLRQNPLPPDRYTKNQPGYRGRWIRDLPGSGRADSRLPHYRPRRTQTATRCHRPMSSALARTWRLRLCVTPPALRLGVSIIPRCRQSRSRAEPLRYSGRISWSTAVATGCPIRQRSALTRASTGPILADGAMIWAVRGRTVPVRAGNTRDRSP